MNTINKIMKKTSFFKGLPGNISLLAFVLISGSFTAYGDSYSSAIPCDYYAPSNASLQNWSSQTGSVYCNKNGKIVKGDVLTSARVDYVSVWVTTAKGEATQHKVPLRSGIQVKDISEYQYNIADHPEVARQLRRMEVAKVGDTIALAPNGIGLSNSTKILENGADFFVQPNVESNESLQLKNSSQFSSLAEYTKNNEGYHRPTINCKYETEPTVVKGRCARSGRYNISTCVGKVRCAIRRDGKRTPYEESFARIRSGDSVSIAMGGLDDWEEIQIKNVTCDLARVRYNDDDPYTCPTATECMLDEDPYTKAVSSRQVRYQQTPNMYNQDEYQHYPKNVEERRSGSAGSTQ